jgi:hypothetical protein
MALCREKNRSRCERNLNEASCQHAGSKCIAIGCRITRSSWNVFSGCSAGTSIALQCHSSRWSPVTNIPAIERRPEFKQRGSQHPATSCTHKRSRLPAALQASGIASVPASPSASLTNMHRHITSGCRTTANSLSPVGPRAASGAAASEPRRYVQST